jgi:hypothetical protein
MRDHENGAYAQKHENGACVCEYEEFERRTVGISVAPSADDEIRGNKHQFPTEVKEQKIRSDENADETYREHCQKSIIHGEILLSIHVIYREKRGCQNENQRDDRYGQADAVHKKREL